MRKVNLSVIRPWVVKKIVELVGFEDEVVVEYAMGLLEDDSQPVSIALARPSCTTYTISLRHRTLGRCRSTSQGFLLNILQSS